MSNLTYKEIDLIEAIIRNDANDVRSILIRWQSSLEPPNININCSNQFYEAPLMIAVSIKNTSNKIIQTLLEHGAGTDLKNKQKETALHIACMHGTSDTVKQLLLHGADPNVKNLVGQTPLYGLCHKYNTNDDDKIKYLLEYNANPNSQDEDGNSALHSLGNCGRVVQYDLIKMIIYEYGADVNIKNRWGETPLFCFVSHVRGINNIAVCNLLLKSNSNINVQLIEKPKNYEDVVVVVGDTPLHCAVRNNNYSLVKMILDCYNPNIRIRNQENETVVDIAKKIINNNNSNKILSYFEQRMHPIRYKSYSYLLKTWLHQKEKVPPPQLRLPLGPNDRPLETSPPGLSPPPPPLDHNYCSKSPPSHDDDPDNRHRLFHHIYLCILRKLPKKICKSGNKL